MKDFQKIRWTLLSLLVVTMIMSQSYCCDGQRIGEECEDSSDCGDRLVCMASSCSFCVVDDDCEGIELCQMQSDGQTQCKAPALFETFDWKDGLTSVIMFIAAMLAAGGGGR